MAMSNMKFNCVWNSSWAKNGRRIRNVEHMRPLSVEGKLKGSRGGNSFEFVQKFHVDISIIIFLHFFLCSLLSLSHTLSLSLLFLRPQKVCIAFNARLTNGTPFVCVCAARTLLC